METKPTNATIASASDVGQESSVFPSRFPCEDAPRDNATDALRLFMTKTKLRTSSQPVVCIDCGETFRDNSALRRHRQHSKDKCPDPGRKRCLFCGSKEH